MRLGDVAVELAQLLLRQRVGTVLCFLGQTVQGFRGALAQQLAQQHRLLPQEQGLPVGSAARQLPLPKKQPRA